jgi:hypothetical protein
VVVEDRLQVVAEMAEVLAEFAGVLIGRDGVQYHAHVCGGPLPDGRWQGWLEFIPRDGGPPRASARETTQPNRGDAVYWATGLTEVYLEGALDRTLSETIAEPPQVHAPQFDEPSRSQDTAATAPARSARAPVLDPFTVYEKGGEARLRAQLSALARSHLVNIIEGYELDDARPTPLAALDERALIQLIVTAVRNEEDTVSK